jgi:hypothetical protein
MQEIDGYIVGVLWAAQFLYVVNFVENSFAKKILTTTLWFVIGLFLFTQITKLAVNGVVLESGMFILQVGLLFLSKKYNFRFLALAFFIHGTWDLVHIYDQEFIHKPLIYSQVCVPYDWMVAVYILWRKWDSGDEDH